MTRTHSTWEFSDSDYQQIILGRKEPSFSRRIDSPIRPEVVDKDAVHDGTEARSEFESLTQDLHLSSKDDEFWWNSTGVSFHQLLIQNSYNSENRRSLLRWYAAFIIPALGPRPIRGEKPRFQPCPVADGSPIEYSLNWKETSSKQLVRFTIEATSATAGTPADLFNQNETLTLLSRLNKYGKMPKLDLKEFHIWKNEFYFSEDGAQRLLSRIPSGSPLSQIWIAFDLPHGQEPMAKVYFMPSLRCIESNIPNERLVFDTARICHGQYGTYNRCIDVLDSYLKASRDEPVIMAALDCIDSPNSRIKVYVQTRSNSLNGAKRVLTLNGQLAGETVAKGLEALEELWSILFPLQTDNIGNAIVFPKNVYCGLAVEFKAGQQFPETKLHLPLREFEGTDAKFCELLSTWFQKRSHAKFGETYRANLGRVLYVSNKPSNGRDTDPDYSPKHDLGGTRGTHTFVSFSYTEKTGVYMTMYYSPRIFDAYLGESRDDFWQGYNDLWQKDST